MANLVGGNAEEHEDDFQYLWGGMDQTGGEWDFDALNEEGGDWNVWGEPPTSNTAYANGPSSSSSNTLPSFDSLFDRETYPSSSRPGGPRESTHAFNSSRMGNAVSAATTAFYSPARPPSAPQPSSSGPANAQTRGTNTGNAETRRQSRPTSFGYLPEAFRLPSDSASFDGIDIDDLLASDLSNGEGEMPRARHEAPRRGRGGNVVDLTAETSPAPPGLGEGVSSSRRMKRSAQEASAAREERRAKRRRRNSHSHLHSPAANDANPAPIEEYDLTTDGDERLLQAQQQAAIAAQQASSPENSARQRIGHRTCIICMESFTNVTITHCGHVYCHECLTQALLAGEKVNDRGTANCPVCRKPVRRTKPNQVIPLSFMTKAKFRGKQRA